jgi:hypothetical protein
MQLSSLDTDGALVCGLAEANAKALEHKLLLTLLLAPEPVGEEVEEGAPPPAPPVFR